MLRTEFFDIERAKEVWYADGRLESAKQIAQNMLLDGFKIDLIANVTDLDRDTIQQLANVQ